MDNLIKMVVITSPADKIGDINEVIFHFMNIEFNDINKEFENLVLNKKTMITGIINESLSEKMLELISQDHNNNNCLIGLVSKTNEINIFDNAILVKIDFLNSEELQNDIDNLNKNNLVLLSAFNDVSCKKISNFFKGI